MNARLEKGQKGIFPVLLAVYIVYLLLCVPITVRASVGVNDVQSAARASVHALLVGASFDGVAVRRDGGLVWRLAPRYGGGRTDGGRIRKIKAARPFAAAILRAAHWRRLEVRMRVGTQEAWSTALAAGSARALALALLAQMRHLPPCDLRVDADFRSPCMVLTARCIFSVRAGDIMLAVLKTAVKKTQKEGFKWISIPSKA